MPVPSNISDLSPDPGDNYPKGSESPSLLDDYQRAHAAFIAQLDDADAAHIANPSAHPQYAPLASPALSGAPTAPTATAGTNTTQLATTEFVQGEKPPEATQAEMEAGTETAVRSMSPAGVAQAIAAQAVTEFASSGENAAGTVEGKAVDPIGIREAFNATGSAPVYACRTWVNFNGTGTVAIRASGNVSSITDNGTGNYTVNFLTNLPHENYAVCGQVRRNSASALVHQLALWASDIKSVSAVQVRSSDGNTGGLLDMPEINVVIVC